MWHPLQILFNIVTRQEKRSIFFFPEGLEIIVMYSLFTNTIY